MIVSNGEIALVISFGVLLEIDLRKKTYRHGHSVIQSMLSQVFLSVQYNFQTVVALYGLLKLSQ